MGIIDVHTHFDPRDPVRGMERALRLADKTGIERLVVLGGAGCPMNPSKEFITGDNDQIMALCRKWPDRLIGFAYLNPLHGRRFNHAEMMRTVADGGLRGVKLLLAANARSPRVDHIMEKAEELNSVILYHCWYKTVCKYPNESDPSDLAHLARRFPNVPIIAAHLTAAGLKGVQDARPYPNLHFDTSGSLGFSEIVEYAVRHLGAERVLFGSDMPGRDFSAQLGRIYDAPITRAQREAILWRSASRLLALS